MTSNVAEGTSPASHTTASSPPPKILYWILGLFFAAVIGLAAAHAPEQIKLIGPFAIVLGLIVGAALGRVGREFAVPLSVWTMCAIGLIVLGTQLANTLEAYRITVQNAAIEGRRARGEREIPVRIQYTAEELQKMPPGTRVLAQQGSFVESCVRKEQTFSQYLLLRLLPLPAALHQWSRNFAMGFWIVEILTATVAGAGIGRRLLRPTVSNLAPQPGPPAL